MIQQHKWSLIISSIVVLLPMIVGLCIWSLLPDQIPIHFDINGNPDSFASKAIAVFAFPGGMLALHWICVLCTAFFDPKSKNNIGTKAFNLVIWITPLINLIICTLMYAYALGLNIDICFVLALVFGIIFIVIGNYLPKCKQSYTIGIKLPWTLNDEDNWNKTHRFGGIVWVIGGILMTATSFLANFWVMIAILALIAIIPTVYSYIIYKESQKDKEQNN